MATIRWILVCGSAAEVGKTTAAERLIRAGARAGARIFAAKLSGTGRARDIARLRSAGAVGGADFVDAGMASTYFASHERLLAMLEGIAAQARNSGASLILAELGGDLLEGGAPEIFGALSAAPVSAAFLGNDAMSAIHALQLLPAGFRTEILARRKNLRSLERRVGMARVFDVDVETDVADLWSALAGEPVADEADEPACARLRTDRETDPVEPLLRP